MRVWRWGAYLLVAAAATATCFALIAYRAVCLDGTHQSCPDGQGPSDELVAQLVVAPVALALAVATLILLAMRLIRLAAVMAVLTAAVCVVWVELISRAA